MKPVSSGGSAGSVGGFIVVSPRRDESDEAQNALRAIVSNPAYGIAALSSSQIMANLLKDLLPDAPREVSILVAAAEAGVAGNLRDRVSQGMDVGTASAVVAGSFAASTPFKPEACSWAVSEIAGALGLSRPAAGPAPGSSIPPGSSVPGAGAPPTISAPVISGPGPARGGYPPGGYPPAAPGPGGYPGGAVPGAYPAGAVPGYPPAPAFPGQAPGGGYQSPPVPGYWSQPPAPGFAPVTRTNGLAVTSLVLGILWLFWLGSLVGLVLGLVALKQVKHRNQAGRGIAIAGVVLSVLWLVGLVVAIIVSASTGS
jgi:hypothetical protein